MLSFQDFFRQRLALLALPALTFAALWAALTLFNGSSSPSGPPALDSRAAVREGTLPGATTDQRIEALQAGVRSAPADPEGYGELGLTYLQKVRETGDPSFYPKAEGVFREALARDPENFTATNGLGSLALARHDFHDALELGQRARRANPTIPRNYGVIADAQIELGRYAAAERTLQHWINLRPELSSYARVSYFRELHGDLRGALEAMRLAVSSGGDTPESFSYVQTLIGNLHLDRGAYAAAERAYRSVLDGAPDYAPALAGLARVEAGRGELGSAIDRYRKVVKRLPLPEYVIALGDAEQAAGRAAAARGEYALVDAQARLLRSNGVNTDVDLALYEANHGSARRAVALGRSAWRAAPSVRSADAYAWALSSAGQDEEALRFSRDAMRLGSRDPAFLYHAGMIARRAGWTGQARGLLAQLVAGNPRFSPLYGPRAERALGELG
jgi:tetratricopeptide (TPR) repeat protein